MSGPRVVPVAAGRMALVDFERPELVGQRVRPRLPGEVLADVIPALLAQGEALTVGWHPNAALVTRSLLRNVAVGPFARPTLAALDVAPSTIISRYDRADLPSPKQQLMLFRMWAALALRASGIGRVSEIGLLINASSPQAFGRFIMTQTGETASGLLARYSPATFRRERVDPVLRWDNPVWERFDPLDGTHRIGRIYSAKKNRGAA